LTQEVLVRSNPIENLDEKKFVVENTPIEEKSIHAIPELKKCKQQTTRRKQATFL